MSESQHKGLRKGQKERQSRKTAGRGVVCPWLCGTLVPPIDDVINSTRFYSVVEGGVLYKCCTADSFLG